MSSRPYKLWRGQAFSTVKIQRTEGATNIYASANAAVPSSRTRGPACNCQGRVPGRAVVRKRWSQTRLDNTNHHLDFAEPWKRTLPAPQLIHCRQSPSELQPRFAQLHCMLLIAQHGLADLTQAPVIMCYSACLPTYATLARGLTQYPKSVNICSG